MFFRLECWESELRFTAYMEITLPTKPSAPKPTRHCGHIAPTSRWPPLFPAGHRESPTGESRWPEGEFLVCLREETFALGTRATSILENEMDGVFASPPPPAGVKESSQLPRW